MFRLTGRKEPLEHSEVELEACWRCGGLGGALQRGGKRFYTQSFAAFALNLFYQKVPAPFFSQLSHTGLPFANFPFLSVCLSTSPRCEVVYVRLTADFSAAPRWDQVVSQPTSRLFPPEQQG